MAHLNINPLTYSCILPVVMSFLSHREQSVVARVNSTWNKAVKVAREWEVASRQSIPASRQVEQIHRNNSEADRGISGITSTEDPAEHHSIKKTESVQRESEIEACEEDENDDFPIFDEDAHSPETFIPRYSCIGTIEENSNEDPNAPKDEKEYILTYEMTSESDILRHNIHRHKMAGNDPVVLLKTQQQYPLPPHLTIESQTNALELLASTAEKDAAEAWNAAHLETGNRNLELRKVAGDLDGKAFTLRQHAEQSKEKKAKLEKEWLGEVKHFFRQAYQLLLQPQNPKQIKTTFELFYKLKELNPLSMVPFLPMLTFLAPLIPTERLQVIIQEAKDTDSYLSYALVLYYIRLTRAFPIGSNFLSFHRQKDILQILIEIFPGDRVVQAYLKAVESEPNSKRLSLQLKIREIDESLTKASSYLINGKAKMAIKILVRSKPLLMGFSNIYRCLTLAWIVEGCNSKADEILQRASKLPNLYGERVDESSFIRNLIVDMLKSLDIPDQTFKDEDGSEVCMDPLEKLLQLVECSESLDLVAAKAFIDVSLANLINSTKYTNEIYLVIYIGIEWLKSRLAIPPGSSEDFRPLFNSLFELMGQMSHVVHRYGHPDEWMSERFKTEGEDSFIRFESLTFGAPQIQVFPKIHFWKFQLTRDSCVSIAHCLVKRLYSIIFGMIISHQAPVLVKKEEEKIEFLPHDITVLLQVIRAGMISRSENKREESVIYNQAVFFLKECLKRDTIRLYSVRPSFLEWARLCVFSFSARNFEMTDCYYSEAFSQVNFSNQSRKLKEVLRLFVLNLRELYGVDLALRDAILASFRLQQRSSVDHSRLSMPENGESIYKIFEFSQRLFGWRLNETFEEWGRRLEKEIACGLFAANYRNLKNTLAKDPIASVPSGAIEISYQADKVREILHGLLLFWKEFHQQIIQKNTFIALGGDENQPSIKNRKWHEGEGVDLKLWVSIIQENKPERYPSFKLLPDKDKEVLRKVIKCKHENLEEIKKLREYNKNIKRSCQASEEMDCMMAAILLSTTEEKREKAIPSIFVDNRAIATSIFRLLLEIAIERSIRQALVKGGPESWEVLDSTKSINILLDALKPLNGEFHGPEQHFSGEAPLPIHFNAHILSTRSFVNTHIFFDEGS